MTRSLWFIICEGTPQAVYHDVNINQYIRTLYHFLKFAIKGLFLNQLNLMNNSSMVKFPSFPQETPNSRNVVHSKGFLF